MILSQKIGFDRVLSQVLNLCTTTSGAELLESEGFSTSQQVVKSRLVPAFEMRNALMMEVGFPSEEFIEGKAIFEKILVDGAFLEAEQLLELKNLLNLTYNIKTFFESKDKYPELKAKCLEINAHQEIANHITTIIDNHGEVKDSASGELFEIRRAIREREGQANKRLQQVLQQAIKNGVVESDAAISIRDGRPVIPVIAANKRKLSGFIHDESATGKTFYIEPVEVVEINNALKELLYSERREIIRILTEFTLILRPEAEELKVLGNFVVYMDMLRAKARFALKNNCTMPIISEQRELTLRNAQHPLLFQALSKEGKSVVPLDLKLDDENRILLISGPNAGGKSVCLKTVGLIQYMLQCGHLVPVSENSEIMLFDRIFLDIGDEQSLENDLSTYSSHLMNMKELLGGSSERSLVLIDEFGAGTEPIMGGAIAESILERLVEKNCFGVITTHFSNLKYYASNASGVMNGGMMFDVQNIRPLFKLEMGTPGSSFAVEIARKIGLSEDIVRSAIAKAGDDNMKVEKLLREVSRDKRYWQQKRDKIRQSEKKLEQLEEKYSTELSGIKDQRARILKEAKDEAQKVVQDANRQIENTIKTIRESQADKDKTKFVRKNLETFKTELEQEKTYDDEKITQEMNKVIERKKRREQRRQERQVQTPERKLVKELITPITLGSKVRIKDQDTMGDVLAIKGKKAEVAFGHIKTYVELSRLVVISNAEAKKLHKPVISKIVISEKVEQRKLRFRQNIDIRGMRLQEAMQEVQDYIDDALMVGVSEVRILHGKGTGALMTEIRKYLKTVPAVASAVDEHIEFGGNGITVVKFDIYS